jgi:anti-anti-sigma factor
VESLGLTYPTAVDVDGRAVLSIHGDVDLTSVERLKQALTQAVTLSPHVTADVADMTFIDSTGLSALVWGHRQAEEAGGSLHIRRPSKMLRRLLELTRLETILTIEDDAAPASSFQD